MCCLGFAARDSDSNCRIGLGPQHNQRHGEGESLRRKRQDKPNPLLRHLKPHDITQNSPYAISGLAVSSDPDLIRNCRNELRNPIRSQCEEKNDVSSSIDTLRDRIMMERYLEIGFHSISIRVRELCDEFR